MRNISNSIANILKLFSMMKQNIGSPHWSIYQEAICSTGPSVCWQWLVTIFRKLISACEANGDVSLRTANKKLYRKISTLTFICNNYAFQFSKYVQIHRSHHCSIPRCQKNFPSPPLRKNMNPKSYCNLPARFRVTFIITVTITRFVAAELCIHWK